jgi:putative ABC transport system permease protein
VNLATLLLARAAQREQEFAVSRVLGANRLALVRATLLEGGLLGLLGGVAGTIAAVWGTGALVALAPIDLPRRESIAVDWGVAGVVIGVGVLLGLFAALLPATWAARTSLTTLLASSAVRGGGGHGRMRRGLVVAQVALSLVLLSSGGLVVRSFERLLRADPGFNPHGLLTLRVPLPAPLFPGGANARALQGRVQEALAAIPGVRGVSATDPLPLTPSSAEQTSIAIPGAPGNTGDPDHDQLLVDLIGTRAGYVEVMDMRMVAGRTFEASRRQGVRQALVDRALANHFFPTGNALGARFPFNGDTLTIVGIVQQTRLYDLHQDGPPQLYVRAEDWIRNTGTRFRTLYFVLRTDREPQALIPEVRIAIGGVDPQLGLAEVRTMDEIVADALRQPRISAVLIAGFALGALLLAAMGLFGVVSGSLLRRRHELAVRLALGADSRSVLRLVLEEGARLVLIGVLIGVPGVILAGRAIRGVLVGVSPSDPATLTGVALVLAAVALTACYLPARRVLRIDPARSLRQD